LLEWTNEYGQNGTCEAKKLRFNHNMLPCFVPNATKPLYIDGEDGQASRQFKLGLFSVTLHGVNSDILICSTEYGIKPFQRWTENITVVSVLTSKCFVISGKWQSI
jgi:hypothetical protein